MYDAQRLVSTPRPVLSTLKHGALRPQKPSRLIRDGRVGGSGIFISNTYFLHCHHQNDSALRWAALWAILMKVSFTVWAKCQDSVHKPEFLKRMGSRSGSNRDPSAYQPSALPLGHTGSPTRKLWALRPQKPLRLIRDGEVGGSGIIYLTPTRWTVTTRIILH